MALPIEKWGPKCARCGEEEYRIDGYCSIYCRDMAEVEARVKELEAVCEVANKAMSCYEEFPGATTQQALRDSFWRLRRSLESVGYRYANDNLDWRGSIIKELNDAGFFPNNANAYEDGSRFVYDPTADKDTPARVFGNAYGPTLAEVVERMRRAEKLIEEKAKENQVRWIGIPEGNKNGQ